jgi:hypothetical protein
MRAESSTCVIASMMPETISTTTSTSTSVNAARRRALRAERPQRMQQAHVHRAGVPDAGFRGLAVALDFRC